MTEIMNEIQTRREEENNSDLRYQILPLALSDSFTFHQGKQDSKQTSCVGHMKIKFCWSFFIYRPYMSPCSSDMNSHLLRVLLLIPFATLPSLGRSPVRTAAENICHALMRDAAMPCVLAVAIPMSVLDCLLNDIFRHGHAVKALNSVHCTRFVWGWTVSSISSSPNWLWFDCLKRQVGNKGMANAHLQRPTTKSTNMNSLAHVCTGPAQPIHIPNNADLAHKKLF